MSENHDFPETDARPFGEPKREESHKGNSQGSSKTRSKPTNSDKYAPRVINISNSEKIHIGNNFNVFSNPIPRSRNPIPRPTTRRQSSRLNPEQEKRPVPEHIQKCFICLEPVTERIINRIYDALVNDWKCLGRKLGFRENYLLKFSATNKAPQEVFHDLLVLWMRVNAEAAIVGVLCQALWETSEYNAVNILVKLCK